MSLQHFEIGLGAGERRFGRGLGCARRGHRRGGARAIGRGLLQALLRTKVRRREFLRAIEFQRRALLIGLGALHLRARGADLRRGLRDDGALRLDLPADARDRRLLRRDLGLGGVDRVAIVAVVEPDEQVARMDEGVVGDRDLGDVAGDFGRDDRRIGADIGVVGADEEAPFDEPIIGEIAAIAQRGDHDDGQNEAARRAGNARGGRRGGGLARDRRRDRRMFPRRGEGDRRGLGLVLRHSKASKGQTEPFGHFHIDLAASRD